MSRPHNEKLFYRALYTPAAFALIDKAYAVFRRAGCSMVARAVAAAYARTHPSVRDTVKSNLALLDPSRATDRAAANVFRNFALGLADYLHIGNVPRRQAAGLCAESPGTAYIRALQAEGKGAILATGHFGFFELGGLLLCELGIPTTVLTLGEPTREFTAWRASFRRRWGTETVEIGSDPFSPVQVVRFLGQGRFCAMLVDRPYLGRSIPVELPAGRILFSTSFALLAYLSGAPILPVAVTRRGDASYRLEAFPPVRVDRGLPRQEAIDSATIQTAAILTDQFLRNPEQWYHFVPIGI